MHGIVKLEMMEADWQLRISLLCLLVMYSFLRVSPLLKLNAALEGEVVSMAFSSHLVWLIAFSSHLVASVLVWLLSGLVWLLSVLP